MISDQELSDWINSSTEDENLEFKEAKLNFGKTKLYKYCVALANEGGGTLVLGITDKVPRRIVGTSAFLNLNKLKSDVRSNVKFNVEAQELETSGKRVLAIRTPSRPKGTAYEYKGAYFMRCGEELQPMTEDRLREIFSETQKEWCLEPLKSGLSSEDVISLLDTKIFFELLGIVYPNGPDEIIEKLISLRLVTQHGKTYTINRLAGLTLANNLNDFPSLSRKAPRLIVYNGKDKLDTRSDTTGVKGYAAGFQGLVRSCMQRMPQNEVVQDALRKTVPLFPERAMREVIANALIHQDLYEAGTGPLLEIYSNRIEVSNPGQPVVPVERFIDGWKSRNETLAWVMRQLSICEERSSGVDRIVNTAEVYQLPAPEFISAHDSTVVVIHGHREFKAMTQDDKVRACYQHCVLKQVMREQMTNDSLRSRFGLGEGSKSAVSKIIKITVDSGFISVDPTAGNSKKYARYVPAWSLA